MSFHISTLFLGRKEGNFRFLLRSNTSALENIRKCHNIPRRIVMPRLSFTTRVLHDNGSEPFSITREYGDGMLVSGTETGVAIPVADCLVTCIVNEGVLAVLHTGFRNMVPLDGTESIIAQALNIPCFKDRSAVHAHISRGIGPCCYSAEHWPEVQKRDVSVRPYINRTTTGPFPNPLSLDLHALAKSQCVHAGIPEHHITTNSRCTSCDQNVGEFVYWSHRRAKTKGTERQEGRNLFIAYLTERG